MGLGGNEALQVGYGETRREVEVDELLVELVVRSDDLYSDARPAMVTKVSTGVSWWYRSSLTVRPSLRSLREAVVELWLVVLTCCPFSPTSLELLWFLACVMNPYASRPKQKLDRLLTGWRLDSDTRGSAGVWTRKNQSQKLQSVRCDATLCAVAKRCGNMLCVCAADVCDALRWNGDSGARGGEGQNRSSQQVRSGVSK